MNEPIRSCTRKLGRSILATGLLLAAHSGWGQGSENFTNLPTASSTTYTSRSWTGTNGVTWTAEGARTDQTINGKAICWGSSGTRNVISPSYGGGMGTLSFNYVRAFTGTGARSIEVWVNGVQQGGSIVVSNTSDVVQNYSEVLNIPGNVALEIRSTGAAQVKLDDIVWTGFSPPTLSVLPTSLNGFLTFAGVPSAAQSFVVDGSNLDEAYPISVTPPPGVEVSLEQNANFTSDPLLIALGSNPVPVTVWVRLSYPEALVLSGDEIEVGTVGASSVFVAITGEVQEGSCTVGASCDDNDPCTVDDVYDGDCNCVGTPTGGTNTTNVTTCTFYTWAVTGLTYTESGTYEETVGCTTEVLNLTLTGCEICGTSSPTACEEYFWNLTGETYTESGTYVWTNETGCTVVTLNLTILQPGTSCDDGNANTVDDTYDAECNCVGTLLPPVVINEVDANTPGTDVAEFVELFGPANEPLDGLVLVFFNGSNDLSYAAYDLDGYSLDANGFFVVGNAGVPNVSITFASNGLQNGPDAVALFLADAADFPNNTPVTTTNLVDALVYDNNGADDAGLLVLLNPGQPQVNESGGVGGGDVESMARVPDGGTKRNTDTYLPRCPTPGTSNTIQPDADQDVMPDCLDDCPFTQAGVQNFDPGTCNCLPGYFAQTVEINGQTVITGCTICPPGSYCPDGLAAIPCPAGQYNGLEGQTACLPCAAGFFSGTAGSTSCSACPAGSFSNILGAASCQLCPAGSFSNVEAATACELCPANTYNPDAGATACLDCGAGTISNEGSTECSPVCTNVAGEVPNFDITTCNCLPGYFATIEDVGGELLITACTICPPGSYCPDGTEAIPCPAGQYNAVEGQTACLSCAPGFFSSTTGNIQCTACPAGSFSDVEGAEFCQACPAGSFSSIVAATSCELCPANTYNPLPGAAECLACGSGEFSGVGAVACTPLPSLVINEVDYDNVGTDDDEWIELFNTGTEPIDLDGMKLDLVNGSNNTVYLTLTLDAVVLPAGGYYVVGNNAGNAAVDQVVLPATNLIQNGSPDAIVLRMPDNTVIDAITYEGDMGAPFTEGTGFSGDDNSSKSDLVIARVPNGTDTDDNSVDWLVWCATPGASNADALVNDADEDGTPNCIDLCPLAVDGIANFDVTTCGCEAGFNAQTVLIGGNDVIVACTPSCTEDVTLVLRTDGNAATQTSWQLLDANTSEVLCQNNGPLPDNTQFSSTCCLPEGCFVLVVTDAGGDGLLGGGYRLEDAGGRRIIDNWNLPALGSPVPNNPFGGADAFSTSSVTGFTPGVDAGEPYSFCLPVGNDRLINVSCDKTWWKEGDFVVANENPAVSAMFAGYTNSSPQRQQSGYEFWFYDPNGLYSFRKFRNHSTGEGAGGGALRACHMRITPNMNVPEGMKLNVKVRGRVYDAGGNLTVFPWGAACRFLRDEAAAQCPPTQLLNIPGNQFFTCGQTRTWSTSSKVHANPVPGATQYQFRFRIAGEPGFEVVRTSSTYWIPLGWTNATVLSSGTYQVDVRAFRGGQWCAPEGQYPWGVICDLGIINSGVQGGGVNSALEPEAGATPAPVLTLWPNPGTGSELWMNIEGLPLETPAGEPLTTVAVDILTLTGQQVTGTHVPVTTPGTIYTQLDLRGSLAAGMYLVRVTAADQVMSQRLVIAP